MTAYAFLNVPTQAFLTLLVIYYGVKIRPGYKKRFLLLCGIVVGLQYLIRFCMLTDITWIQALNTGKVLNIIMISLLVFWGGTMVYEGWARIGVILLVEDCMLSVSQRGYWEAWAAITHASKEELLVHEQLLLTDFPSVINQVTNVSTLLIMAFVIRKLRKYPLPSIKAARVITLIYFVFGCSPFIQRIGFDGGTNIATVWMLTGMCICFFFLVMAILKNLDHGNRRMLYLKEQMLDAQLTMMREQEEYLRRFRHDIRRHREALEYLSEECRQMEDNLELIQYREELKTCEKAFSRAAYSGSAEADIGLEQIAQFCDEHTIPCTIQLRRLQFSGWKSDDCMLFGILLSGLVLMQIENNQCNEVQIKGDCLNGQNMMQAVLTQQNPGQTRGTEKNRQLSEEKDLQYLLRNHNGMLECRKEGNTINYLLSWPG